ncbi:MAG TPA: tetratricopeptide repeat protein [Dongiaceae bacterium]|nr:tetratricopeptide repeat protein [Dongiaceae bacterium]
MLPSQIAFALLLSASLAAFASDKQENWIEVTSPHFIVATDGSEKQGRRVADQFERMRSVFHAAFPKLNMDSGAPIAVIAVKGEKDFRALEPEAYLAKGSLKLGGLFLRTAEKNYVLMRLDAEGEHPYSIIYHEYTHFLISKGSASMPLWLNEGLAEFYQNTDIQEKQALLGEPSAEDLLWLRQNRLLPLETLLSVDHNSPYYHEEKKGSIFYAESWALTHMIQISDAREKAQHLSAYVDLVGKNVDPVTAASSVFGDLKKLQSQLEDYVHQPRYYSFKMATTTQVDDSAFKLRALSPTDSAALRADFLAYNERTADAQALLDRVLEEDPKNVSARETKGYLAFRKGNTDEARKWYREAVQLDSQSALAHYYFGAMAMNSAKDAAEQAEVEASLRAAVKLDPTLAPAFDRLAVFLGMHHKNLDEAHMMGLTAVTLDPANIGYRINVANVLLAMGNTKSVIPVLRAAAKLAKNPEESQMVADLLTRAEDYADAQDKSEESQRQLRERPRVQVSERAANADPNVPKLKHRDFVAKGPHRFAVGVLKSVSCDNPALDLTLAGSSGKSLSLHVDNYYQIAFTALGFSPSSDLNPCKDLEDRPAKIEYVESANPSVAAQLISVELHK